MERRLQLLTALAAAVALFAAPAVWACAEAGLFMSCEPAEPIERVPSCHGAAEVADTDMRSCCLTQPLPEAAQVVSSQAQSTFSELVLSTTAVIPAGPDRSRAGSRLAPPPRLDDPGRYVLHSAYLL